MWTKFCGKKLCTIKELNNIAGHRSNGVICIKQFCSHAYHCWLLRRARPRRRLMLRVSLTPGVHFVPGAMLIAALHWPEAQRWKLLPSMQFQAPSLLQAPVCAPLPPPAPPAPPVGAGCEVVVVATGTEEDAEEEPAAEDEVADEDAEAEAEVVVMSVVAVAVAVAVAASPVVRKTPPVGVLEDVVSLVSVTGMMIKISEVEAVMLLLEAVVATSVVADVERVSEGLCEEAGILVEGEGTYISVVDVDEVTGS